MEMSESSEERSANRVEHCITKLRSVGQGAPALLESLLLLALVVAGALVGLALQQNWLKILRVASASLGYFTALFVAVRSPPARAKGPGVYPYWPFCLAGAVAGLMSAVVRPSTSLALIMVQVLGAGFLLGGVHWIALRWWSRVRSRLEY